MREAVGREIVDRLWPEIQWISNAKLREQVTQTWIKALERSALKPDDLNQIPFTLLSPTVPSLSWSTSAVSSTSPATAPRR